MKYIEKDAVIIGAGPAGLAAGLELKENGIDDLVIIERKKRPGGILGQCIHDGFGLYKFGEVLTGPEYAHYYIEKVNDLEIPILTESTVTELTEDKIVTVVSPEGLLKINAEAVILSMGCRERTRGNISIPGTRPAGIFTAGVVQRLVNIQNIMVGERIVVLGSGDIGLIMARRLTLEGAEVKAVIEKLPYAGGLERNVRQCLKDYDIPLLLNHTVIEIEGKNRVKAVKIEKVDGSSKERITCDTVILSVGLIPENELSKMAGIEINPAAGGPAVDEFCQTNIPGIFACGNVLHVHDLVDYVSEEAERAGRAAARFIKNEIPQAAVEVKKSEGIDYVLPDYISGRERAVLSLRCEEPVYDKDIIISEHNGSVVKKIEQARLMPSQMVRFELSGEELRGVSDLKVELR